MQKTAAMKRAGAVMGVTIAVLCVLLVAFSYYHATRATISPYGELSLWDTIVMNSDIIMGLVFLAACSVPFFLKFERRKPRAREMVPLAVMAALGVVGRTVFQLIPLPNFKPVSALVIITAVAFGPEAGFMTGALAAFVSNFIFGQGPWTPWQMFCWGMIGFVAGRLQKSGFFEREKPRRHFASPMWDRICPANTSRGDMLHYARGISERASFRLCMFGLLTGFGYGWVMNLYYIIGYINPITWQSVAAAYVSSFFFDLSHGVCTFLVLWALGTPWIKKLNRVKVKFGLDITA